LNNKHILLILFVALNLYAKNLNYVESSNHTLVLPQGKVNISYSKTMMNDTIDILKIKEKEFSNSVNYDAIGDMDGYELKVRYGITNSLMFNYKRSTQNIEYSSSTLTNTQDDIFLRYNIFQYQLTTLNSGVSLDIGYTINKLNDYYMNDFDVMKNLVKKVDSSMDMILRNGISYVKTQDSFGNDIYTPLPYIVLKDTSDESNYIRLLTGFYTKRSVFDFYIGYKKTKIKNLITTTTEIIELAQDYGYQIEQRLNRSEKMYMAGFNYSVEHNKFIYEFGFEYDKFIRDEGLDYIDYNYIFDMSITRYINKNLSVFVGSKIMYRQLNGQIPYLYNQYTQTSYDHKYGYANAGIQFNF
jgi:hypothetical protein